MARLTTLFLLCTKAVTTTLYIITTRPVPTSWLQHNYLLL